MTQSRLCQDFIRGAKVAVTPCHPMVDVWEASLAPPAGSRPNMAAFRHSAQRGVKLGSQCEFMRLMHFDAKDQIISVLKPYISLVNIE